MLKILSSYKAYFYNSIINNNNNNSNKTMSREEYNFSTRRQNIAISSLTIVGSLTLVVLIYSSGDNFIEKNIQKASAF